VPDVDTNSGDVFELADHLRSGRLALPLFHVARCFLSCFIQNFGSGPIDTAKSWPTQAGGRRGRAAAKNAMDRPPDSRSRPMRRSPSGFGGRHRQAAKLAQFSARQSVCWQPTQNNSPPPFAAETSWGAFALGKSVGHRENLTLIRKEGIKLKCLKRDENSHHVSHRTGARGFRSNFAASTGRRRNGPTDYHLRCAEVNTPPVRSRQCSKLTGHF